jgi:hypothetical protein
MLKKARRLATVGAATLLPVAFATIVTPGVSTAVECGWGTVFDPPSNTCVAAPAPPPPAWNGDITPYFSIGVCAPIPFVSICTGI